MLPLRFNTKGFTLVEIIVAVMLMSLLLLLILSTYLIAQKAYTQSGIHAELIQNGRAVLDRMERELRQATDIVTIIPPDDNNPALIPHEIQFQDGHDTSNIHYIRYYLTGSVLKRQVIAYHFLTNPGQYVLHDALDATGYPPATLILEDNIVAEYVGTLNFYGDTVTYIFIQLTNKNKSVNLLTEFYARNL
jgi:prepilin-type N-terminal cleavage/methylation domain-containing protein